VEFDGVPVVVEELREIGSEDFKERPENVVGFDFKTILPRFKIGLDLCLDPGILQQPVALGMRAFLGVTGRSRRFRRVLVNQVFADKDAMASLD
jgi:hypothetical protein